MEILFLVGRIIFGGYFVMNGTFHFTKHKAYSGYATSKGVSMPNFAVYGTGALLLVGGLGMMLGIYIEWAVAALALFLIPVSFTMHNFWAVRDPMTKMSERINFMKNMGLLGAALMMLAIPQPWVYAIL